MVHVGSTDHRARHLLVRSQRACRARGVYRHYRPQLPPAGAGPRLRQQPGGPYVAGDDPPGEVLVVRPALAPPRRERRSAPLRLAGGLGVPPGAYDMLVRGVATPTPRRGR